MRIDLAKFENYENLTAEEKVALLEGFEYDDHSAELQKEKAELDRYKNAVSKANSEAKQWKDKHNALLSEDERKKEESAEAMESLKTELATLKQEKTISEYTSQYIALGYSPELAKETATAFANGDFQKTMQSHAQFLADQKKFMEAEALKKQPDLTAGTPPTKEQLELAELDPIFKAAGV